MALYPGTELERRVSPSALGAAVAGIFEHCRMDHEDAALLADTLVQADLRGIHSHGVLRVPEYVAKLTEKGVNPTGKPEITRDGGAAMVVDGNNAMGQIAVTFAMTAAIARAKTLGVCAVTVGGSNHCGAMDYFAQRALPHDMIGIATTNAIPTMAPVGGVDRIVGMNPIGVALPTESEAPFVFDGAFGMTAHGKIRVYGQKGFPLPTGWAYDRDGNSTSDPAVALAGLIAPAGGHKGIALAMVMGVLSTLLSGAGYGDEAGDVATGAIAGRDGQFVLAIDVAAFVEVVQFKRRLDGILRRMVSSRPMQGVEQVYYPGLMEHQLAKRYRQEGIPLNAETLNGVTQMAKRMGVSLEGIA